MTQAKFSPVEEQLAYLKKGVAEIVPEVELRTKLEQSLKSGKPLRVYLGVDPTAPDIHLGHTVVLRKLKHFQDMGHTAVFLVGDFSAMIGDPTGQSETRPPLSREQVDLNAKTYLAQVYKILDPARTEVRYNSEWLGKMSSYDVVRLCGHYRLARMLEREDFRSRLDKNLPIAVHELLYPLLTAYDAVMLQSDVELGAKDVQEPGQLRRDYRAAGRNVRQNDVHSRRADVVVLQTGHRPHSSGNRIAERSGAVRPDASNGCEDETCGRSCERFSRRGCRSQSGRKFPAGFPRPSGASGDGRSPHEASARWPGNYVPEDTGHFKTG